MSLSSIAKSLKSGWKSLVSSTSGKAFLGGLGTFFGFEWLTGGGLGESVSGALGVNETTGNILVIIVLCLVIYLAFRFLDSKIPSGPRSGEGGKR